jgi:hypothetical protein
MRANFRPKTKQNRLPKRLAVVVTVTRIEALIAQQQGQHQSLFDYMNTDTQEKT